MIWLFSKSSNISTRDLLEVIRDRDEYFSPNQVFGVWKGYVEWNQDPFRLGRIKARLYNLHGTAYETSIEELPWASRISPVAGGYDSGSFSVPSVGSTVLVIHEGGDTDKPMYIGGYFGIPDEGQVFGYTLDSPEIYELRNRSMGKWESPAGLEIPWEARAVANSEPTVHIISKSVKGHTIYYDDRDEVEKLEIIDRAGQFLSMRAALTEESNAGNAEARRGRSVMTGNHPDIENTMVGKVAEVSLADAGGQSIILHSRLDEEGVYLSSKKASESRANILGGSERQSIELSVGHNRTTISSAKDDQVISQISMDSHSGKISLDTVYDIKLEADVVSLDASNVYGGRELQVADKFEVSGDLLASGIIVGQINAGLSGTTGTGIIVGAGA